VSAPFLGSWLSVTPTTGTASQIPTPLTVSVNPTGLAPGTYTGTITINSAGASNTQTINVTYTLSSLPTPVVSTIWNAASLQPGPVAAGELITLKGSNLGPGTPITSAITPGTTLPTQVVGTQVTFDGIPAPLLYVSSVQVNTIVPYGIAGRVQTQMVITVNGVSAPPIALRVTDSSPAIFFENLPTVPVSQGAILNADGSLNSPQNPAARGTSIAIFATGEGTTNAPGIDGLVTPIDPNSLKHPVQAVHVFIGGQEAELQYAGSAPGLVNGMFQVNVKIPDTVPAGPTIGIAIQVGNNSSPDIVTLALQ
jgi:uncharacterized protein (TIGR03437 family)